MIVQRVTPGGVDGTMVSDGSPRFVNPFSRFAVYAGPSIEPDQPKHTAEKYPALMPAGWVPQLGDVIRSPKEPASSLLVVEKVSGKWISGTHFSEANGSWASLSCNVNRRHILISGPSTVDTETGRRSTQMAAAQMVKADTAQDFIDAAGQSWPKGDSEHANMYPAGSPEHTPGRTDSSLGDYARFISGEWAHNDALNWSFKQVAMNAKSGPPDDEILKGDPERGESDKDEWRPATIDGDPVGERIPEHKLAAWAEWTNNCAKELGLADTYTYAYIPWFLAGSESAPTYAQTIFKGTDVIVGIGSLDWDAPTLKLIMAHELAHGIVEPWHDLVAPALTASVGTHIRGIAFEEFEAAVERIGRLAVRLMPDPPAAICGVETIATYHARRFP